MLSFSKDSSKAEPTLCVGEFMDIIVGLRFSISLISEYSESYSLSDISGES